MSQSTARNADSLSLASAPTQVDAATAELLMTLRLNRTEPTIASGDVARRYVLAEPSVALSVNHVVR